MRKRSKKTVEASFTKRIAAVIMTASYISVISPITLLAETAINNADIKGTVSVKEEKSEVLISAEEGGTVVLGEASIEIPEGALKKDTRISITRLYKVEDTGESLCNATAHPVGYRFLPAGTKFEKDVTITLPYSVELNAKPQALSGLYTYFYDTQKESWIKLERLEVDKENHKVRSLSTHFTDMINATLALPESAGPADVNLNSIKNLEAARPDGHLIKFNPPEAGNMGDASFSFELAVPAGRKGMQPQISVSYSSGGGNGIMGRGFDAGYGSSITTDTRLGLPDYDTRDTYMLDGTLLEEKSRKGDEITYRPLKETSFSRIKRYLDDNHWEVTDKSGTKRIYAQNKDSCVGSGAETFTWNLTRTEDANGNSVVYEYEKDSGYVYPAFIHYTGFNGKKGNYKVQFHYDNNGTETRKDVRMDARSREIISCKKLLTSITTHYKDEGYIRKYNFNYTEGLAKEKMLVSLAISNNAGESYEYTFDYSLPEKNNDGNIIYFAEAKEWSNGQPLQVGNSTNIGANFNGAAGLGYGTRVIDVRATAGGSGSVSSGESYTEDSMLDINGDGRPDAVSQDGNTIYVSLNNGSGFDERRAINIKSGSLSEELDHEKNSSSSVGWNIYGGAGAISAALSLGVGYSEVRQRASSRTLCSFIDMDGDGLPDIAEAGKSTYLKNLGNLEFGRRSIYSSVAVTEAERTVEPELAEEYRKTYFVQTPFRMWKAPYEGVISITESAHGISENFDKTKQVILRTYEKDNENDDAELRINVAGPDTAEASKTMDADKASEYYFISDSGREPEKTDIEWDINIEYSDVKTFKKGLRHPFLSLRKYEELAPARKTYYYGGDKAREDYKAFIAAEYLDGRTELLKLFAITVQEAQADSGSPRGYTLGAQYDPGWTKKTSVEEQKSIISALMENNCLIPSVFTEPQFNEYYESVKANTSKAADIVKYYSDFAMQFEHDVADNLYLFRDFSKKYSISDFLETYPIPDSVQKAALSNYNQNGISASFSADGIFYERHSEKEFSGGRSIENEGTVTNKVLNAGTYNSSDLFIDLVDNKLKFRGDKENFVPLDISSDVINTTVTENSVSIQYGINKDKYGNYESILTATLEGLSYRATNLSSDEFQKIADDIDVAFSNVHDAHWKLKDTEDESKRVKTSGIDALFKGMELPDSRKEEFISALYEKKDALVSAEAVNPEEAPKEEATYSYYVLKENADYDRAQEILDEYKREIVYKEKFPFYAVSSGSYVLKDEWKDFKEEEDARSEWTAEIEAEILEAEPGLKQENPTEFSSRIENIFAGKYKEYMRLDSLLLSECRKFGLGKFSSVRVSQEFNTEHLHHIESSSYSLVVAENGFNLSRATFTLPKAKWNSGDDYSTDNMNRGKAIYSYNKTITQDGVTDTAVEEIKIQSDEFLYGGKDGWFYGIWKGSLADVPFSGKRLKEYKSSMEGINSEEDFNSRKNSVPTEISERQKEQKAADSVHFYLPQRQDECEFARNASGFRNASVPYTVDYSESLLGTVAMYSEARKTSAGRETATGYYMPFIFGNIIHADRAGGISYYKVEGLSDSSKNEAAQPEGSSLLSMPAIRKSYTEAIDRTPVAKAGIGPVSADFSKTSNSSSAKDSYNLAVSLPGGSASAGENISTSTASQILQDVNGDGIPDIVQIDNGVLRIIEGAKLNESGEISFNKEQVISGTPCISRNETSSKVYGGSVSAQGSVRQVPRTTSYGSIKHVVVEPQASTIASGGLTYSESSSLQTRGIGDINGDGIPDYYDGNFYALGNGSSFSPDYTGFSAGNISESRSQSIGMNFSAGISGIAGAADLQAAKTLRTCASGTAGITCSSTSSSTGKMVMDINGDGLQDILEMESGSSVVSVRYNTGCGFTPCQAVELPGWKNYVKDNLEKFLAQADSNGFDLGLIKDIPVIGTAASKGLTSVSINPFGFDAENLSNSLDWSTSVTVGLNGSVGANLNIGIDIIVPLPPFYIGTINITAAGGAGANASSTVSGVSVRMADLDGDGLPDHVMRIPGAGTYWKRNISGRYGLLTGIGLPQGGNVRIEYAGKYGTTDNPNFKYVMSRVTMDDGCGETLPAISHGEHSVAASYEYDGGYYDRRRKDFYGFQTVRTTSADGTYQIDEYYNREYYAKGSIRQSCMYTADGELLSKTETTLCDCPAALPSSEKSWTFEKASGKDSFIYTAAEYKYDGFGNCTQITQDFGDGESLSAQVIYDNTDTGNYIIGLPVDIRVYDSKGTLLRHRSGDYDGRGRLTELRRYFDSYNYSVDKFSYDSYGNIKSVTDSRGATLSYKYDKDENMFVNEVSQSGMGTDSYESKIDYDVPTQTKKSETDCRGNTFRYEYDSWQRIKEIWTSYDTGTTAAVSYEYKTPNNDSSGHHELWHAVTNNKVTFDASDDSVIQTILQIDGLGRTVRIAKTGFVNGADGWNASGAVEYDSKGRAVKEGMTEFIPGGIQTLLEAVPRMTSLYTAYEYDEKDRKAKTTLPDGSVQTTEFYIEENRLITETADPLGNVSVQETDSRGNIVRVAKKDAQGKLLTQATYRYSAMNEMLKAFDAKGNPVIAEYDLLGRRTALESLDSGRQEFFYDECSNLVRESSSVLRENNKQIVYKYDGLNRLVRIDYPDTEDTVYTYGGADDTHGAAGKILSVTDASGTFEYEYGKLGETTKETRTLSTHLNGNNPTETAVMEYRSDYLGRMQWIAYPDGEKVTYGYDNGGQVISVTGSNYGNEFNYVTNILYDQYGQRTRIDYGNGTFTEYNYDPARRWLNTIKTENKWGQSYQNISYSFDAVGNVLGYENDCLDSVTGNYKTKQTYSYDNLYQLIKVSGETTYNPYQSSVPEFVSTYSQAFGFDADGLGNMTSKVSSETVSPQKSIGDNLNYSFNYVYDDSYAHRLSRAGDRYYKYDNNGNIVCEQDGSFESNGEEVSYHKITQESENVYSTDYGWGLFKEDDKGSSGKANRTKYKRTYKWNERNQLVSSVDDNYSTAYVYGQDGQRSNKYTQNSETLYFNKMWTLHSDSGNNVYGGQTAKNIYLGDTRIVTKLNSGHEPTYNEEYYKQYYYHSDHLGSASLITDYKGDEYQRIEYTPYGETWVEKTSNTGLEWLPYKFTAKELDEETGLYYYGARYLDPKYSMWISTDPALGEYIPKAPIDEEAKKYNQNLPGMGGVFNHINGNLYHYAGNNPVKYTDPDGRMAEAVTANPSFWTGVCIILGTIAEDIVTLGVGLADDPATIALGVGIIAGVCYAKNRTNEQSVSNIDTKLKAIGLSRTKNRNNNYSITFQAQGAGMYQNIRKGTTQGSKVIQVFSDKPITKKQALGSLSILYSELNQKEQANMLGTFTEAAEWIESVKGGYVSPYKSIQQKNDPTGNRIDMIFRGGYNLTDN
ncbi:toxin TcdB middle/N-terminal domain-containing protein [Treponema succinifaciens]|uniref:toxin TcdB middle/N-terminal domain-containing protein n=1 Tax=Treponema succinifaciens TaxID=167 RepID=UPI0023F11D9E|nr:toxin TcdB middle/N-terminal domain-containing protein [Treponema succinifaciens]